MSTRKRKIQDWLETRRLRAVELRARHWKQSEIADAYGVTPGAVSQWMQAYDRLGTRALRSRKKIGAPARLTTKQLERIPRFLSRGAESYGYRGELWTYPRVSYVIEREFGVHYHPGHVCKLMKALGWTPHKPMVLANQRDEGEIERWRSEVWPRLKKSPTRE